MNEKISYLMRTAWLNVEGECRPGMEEVRESLYIDMQPTFEEFAKLIAEDCAKTLVELSGEYRSASSGNEDQCRALFIARSRILAPYLQAEQSQP